MMRLTGKDLIAASLGEWLNDIPESVQGIGTDTRQFKAGEAFLALRGPSFDGHEHAHQVADRAAALIGDKQGVQHWKALATPQLQVQDTLQSLGDIAAFYRSRLLNTKVVAITGSYGKTTVRSMLEVVLKHLGLQVAATQGNFNNLIGVPQTLLGIDMQADVALIECGISEQGEMLRLSEIVQPDMVIVTGLSQAHGEGLGGLKGIAKEKAALMAHLSKEGCVVLGHGVASQFEQVGCMPKQQVVSMDEQGVTWQLDGQTLTLKHEAKQASVDLLLPAKHWAEDMALATQVALTLGDVLDQDFSLVHICEALAGWQPVQGRLAIHSLSHFTLIDDSYNANPASMQAALDTLAALEGHRIAIIGDMLELGEDAIVLHQQLNLHDIDEVLIVGALMGGLKAVNSNQNIQVFTDIEALQVWFESNDFPKPLSTVLVKASHGTGLHNIVKPLQARGQHVI